ncbi:MAG: hypothetical protein WD607_06225, partial [Candidatus Paceibacterota bacterium]
LAITYSGSRLFYCPPFLPPDSLGYKAVTREILLTGGYSSENLFIKGLNFESETLRFRNYPMFM